MRFLKCFDSAGDCFRKQRKKTTTYCPPAGVTPGKAEKLAKQYAAVWEEKIKGYVALDENITFAELAEWYYSTVAPQVLKPNVLENNKKSVYNHIIPIIGREKLKNITPLMLDRMLIEFQKTGNRYRSFKLKDKSLRKESKMVQTKKQHCAFR